jgi:ACT domain-containing protein
MNDFEMPIPMMGAILMKQEMDLDRRAYEEKRLKKMEQDIQEILEKIRKIDSILECN